MSKQSSVVVGFALPIADFLSVYWFCVSSAVCHHAGKAGYLVMHVFWLCITRKPQPEH